MSLNRAIMCIAVAISMPVDIVWADQAVLTPLSKENSYVVTSYTGSILIDLATGKIIAKENIADPELARQYFEQYIILGPNAPANNSPPGNEVNVIKTLYPDLASRPLEEQVGVLQDIYIDSAFSNFDPNKPGLSSAATDDEMNACRERIVAKKREAVINDALADGSPLFDTTISIRLLQEGVPAWQIDSKLSELKSIKAKERELEQGKAELEFRRIMLTGQIAADSPTPGGRVQTPEEVEKDGNIQKSPIDPIEAIVSGGLKAAVGGTSKEVIEEIVSSVVEDIAEGVVTSDQVAESLREANERMKERNLSCAAQANSPVCK